MESSRSGNSDAASSPATASAESAARAGSFELGGLTIWGVDGDTVSESDFALTDGVLTVNTGKHFAIQSPDQTLDADGAHTNPVNTRIAIPAGVEAHITLAGVGVKALGPIDTNSALDIAKGAICHLTLADGTVNSFVSTASNGAGIHNPTGATLTIDDSVANKDINGNPIIPEGGFVPADLTLANGKKVRKGDNLTVMDSDNPGSLYVWCSTGMAAAVGGYGDLYGAGVSNAGEAGGNFTMDGGLVTIRSSYNYDLNRWNCSAALGGGAWGGPGTGPDEWITINGGRLTAIGGMHGAGIGSGNEGATGNIQINGGYVVSRGGDHGSGFGAACNPRDSSAYKIILTGGTLIPSTVPTPYPGTGDIGAPNANITITGGSIGNGRDVDHFTFEGSAHNAEGEPIRMVQIDLTSDVGASTYPITRWQLLVDGRPYDYGAPAEFDKGHLYLWLPETIIKESEVTVDFSYLITDKVSADGNPVEVTPLPVFRPAGDATDGKLRRYADFTLPPEYTDRLVKPYDGLPFATYAISPDDPLRTEEEIGTDPDTGEPVYRWLTNAKAVTYKYQLYDRREGTPAGPEVDSGADMPRDVGIMKFTMTSSEYSKTDGFKESYWGHRATGWCEITPVASKVASVTAKWADGSDVADAQLPEKVLDVSVDVTSGDGTAATCKAPTGKVQLYVDGEPVGDPVEIRLSAGTAADGSPLPANAAVRTDADGREHTVVSWSFPAGELMAPGARHKISARYIPAINYLESTDPAEGDVPESEVAVRPDPKIAPAPAVSKAVENLTHPEGPTQPGDRLRYTVTASNSAAGSLWTDVVLTDALPKCLDLDASTLHLENSWEGVSGAPSAGDGKSKGTWALSAPGADGRRTLSVGAGAVAGGSSAVLTFECTVGEADFAAASGDDLDLANIAEADGTRPDPADPDSPMPDPDDPGKPLPVAPSPTDPVTPPGGGNVAPSDPDIKVSKSVENATSPGAKMTRVGDTLRYEIVVENRGPASSCLLGAVVSDPLPAGIEPVAGTIRMALADGTDVAVPDSAYDAGSRTVAVTAGDLWGGQRVTLTFDATVGEAALGTDAANVAFAHGTVPSEEPGDGSQPQNPEPGKPAPVPPADDDPVASSDPAVPPVVVGDDPEEGDLSISKEAENLTRSDGTTRVGDTVRYTIVLRNEGPSTSWMDAAIRDDVPEGLEPIAGTIRMALPDGTELDVPDDAYDHRSRVLAVAAGSLHGGQSVTLAFDALVTEAALDADIGNTALAYGQPPSRWDPDGEHPEPGSPFDPPEGWEEYGRTREVIESPAAYPPGVTRDGGVLPAEGPVDDSATIAKTRLAQTGDALGRLAGTLAGAAAGSLLVAGALALATRRARAAR